MFFITFLFLLYTAYTCTEEASSLYNYGVMNSNTDKYKG